jgi:hypothetical protein
MATLFSSYSVKGNLKFYRNDDDEEKITLSFGINANHQPDEKLYEKISDFLEKVLIEDYCSEDSYLAKKAYEKELALTKKNQDKYIKEQEKKALLLRKQAKKTSKTAVVKKKASVSLY